MDADRRTGLDAALVLAALAVAWLTLTPAGEAALSALTAHAAAHDAALDRLVGAGNRAALLDTLRRLVAGLDTDET